MESRSDRKKGKKLWRKDGRDPASAEVWTRTPPAAAHKADSAASRRTDHPASLRDSGPVSDYPSSGAAGPEREKIALGSPVQPGLTEPLGAAQQKSAGLEKEERLTRAGRGKRHPGQQPSAPAGTPGEPGKRNRRRARTRLDSPWHRVMEYILLVIGSLLIALSFNLFFYPNQLASGGVSGLSIIADSMFGLEPALTQWALNIPLFFAGLLLIGRNFGVKTAVGSVLLPLLVLLTRELPSLTTNILLASIYGGILLGIGIGLVYRGRGSTGGFSVAAQILHKYTGIGFGLCVALLDGLVIVTAGIFISPEKAMYALIGLFVTSKTINVVQIGLSYSKVAFIISDSVEEIREAILYELDRGLTKLQATGGYTGEDRTVLMVVVGQTEVTRLKELVRSVDPQAFVILSDTNEVLGEGFKLTGPS